MNSTPPSYKLLTLASLYIVCAPPHTCITVYYFIYTSYLPLHPFTLFMRHHVHVLQYIISCTQATYPCIPMQQPRAACRGHLRLRGLAHWCISILQFQAQPLLGTWGAWAHQHQFKHVMDAHGCVVCNYERKHCMGFSAPFLCALQIEVLHYALACLLLDSVASSSAQ